MNKKIVIFIIFFWIIVESGFAVDIVFLQCTDEQIELCGYLENICKFYGLDLDVQKLKDFEDKINVHSIIVRNKARAIIMSMECFSKLVKRKQSSINIGKLIPLDFTNGLTFDLLRGPSWFMPTITKPYFLYLSYIF